MSKRKPELTKIFNRFMNHHHRGTGVNARFGRGPKASDKTKERKNERTRGEIVHNPMKQGTYRRKI